MPAESDDCTLEWTAHPARERPLTTLSVLTVILAFGLAVESFAPGGAWGLVAGVILLASLHRYFLPSRQRLDGRGVEFRTCFGRRALAWTEIRRVELQAHAAWLSPLAQRTWFGSRRGITLLLAPRAAAARARLERFAARCGTRSPTRTCGAAASRIGGANFP